MMRQLLQKSDRVGQQQLLLVRQNELARGRVERREKLIRRVGTGRKADPYRYRLPNADDEYWDRGELPPLGELGPLLGS